MLSMAKFGAWSFRDRTFIPYCNLATSALSEMNVNSFRLHVKGRGRIRSMNKAISDMSIKKTYGRNISHCKRHARQEEVGG